MFLYFCEASSVSAKAKRLPLPDSTLTAAREGEVPAAPFHRWELGCSLASRGPAAMGSCCPTASSLLPLHSHLGQGLQERPARGVSMKGEAAQECCPWASWWDITPRGKKVTLNSGLELLVGPAPHSGDLSVLPSKLGVMTPPELIEGLKKKKHNSI